MIIDELGYLALGPSGPLLLQFYADRYGCGSLVITSNLEFSRWAEVFGDATLASALLDRIDTSLDDLALRTRVLPVPWKLGRRM